MSRDFQINGESLVKVKGMTGTAIGSLSELGLSPGPINVTFDFRHRDINVDAWGGEIPADVQGMLAAVNINMPLIHIDYDILNACMRESMCGSSATGTLVRAGTRMGGNAARFAAGNHYIGVNILSPIIARPYRFLFSYLTGPPVVIPLGTEKSVFQLNWRVIPYTQDPWGNGSGATGQVLWDNNLDT